MPSQHRKTHERFLETQRRQKMLRSVSSFTIGKPSPFRIAVAFRSTSASRRTIPYKTQVLAQWTSLMCGSILRCVLGDLLERSLGILDGVQRVRRIRDWGIILATCGLSKMLRHVSGSSSKWNKGDEPKEQCTSKSPDPIAMLPLCLGDDLKLNVLLITLRADSEAHLRYLAYRMLDLYLKSPLVMFSSS